MPSLQIRRLHFKKSAIFCSIASHCGGKSKHCICLECQCYRSYQRVMVMMMMQSPVMLGLRWSAFGYHPIYKRNCFTLAVPIFLIKKFAYGKLRPMMLCITFGDKFTFGWASFIINKFKLTVWASRLTHRPMTSFPAFLASLTAMPAAMTVHARSSLWHIQTMPGR